MMRLAALVVCLLYLPLPHPATAQSTVTLRFEDGNRHYEEGRYLEAADIYEALIADGVESADLYYNLGNSYYKANDLGRCVLNYERALQITPRDADLRQNMSLVSAQLKDRQFVGQESPLLTGLSQIHRKTNVAESVAMTSGIYLFLCLLIALFVLRRTRAVSALYRRTSLLSVGRLIGLSRTQDMAAGIVFMLLLLIGAGASTYQKVVVAKKHPRGVVVEREVPVLGSPTDDGTLQFRIHEGTRVRLGDERAGYTYVELPGQLSGWVATAAVARI